MKHGAEVGKRLRKSRSGGIPWMVILDADGKELISSDGPEGNCGYPYQPHEIAHFVKMIRSTANDIDDKEIQKLKDALDQYRENREKGR